MDTLGQALKEWQVAVTALACGETVLLLRKGGIREPGGRFAVKYDRVWLYPTVEHQQAALLQPAYATAVQPVESGWHPTAVELRAWADITAVYPVRDEATALNLLPWLVWNQEFIRDRWHWKPQQPLLALVLRVHRLARPTVIPYSPNYGGCQSWIELETAIATAPSTPALDNQQFEAQCAAIREIVAP